MSEVSVMPFWLQLFIAIGTILATGGALVSFWAWARAKLVEVLARLAVIETWKEEVEDRCRQHHEDRQALTRKLDGLRETIANTDTETARAIGRLEGKVDVALKGDR